MKQRLKDRHLQKLLSSVPPNKGAETFWNPYTKPLLQFTETMGRSIESSRPIMAPSVSLICIHIEEWNHYHRLTKTNLTCLVHCQPRLTRITSQVSSKRTSKRFSTFSGVPSLAASDCTQHTTSSSPSNDSRLAEIKEWTQGFDRLEQKRLQQQRYQPTPEKTDNLNKLALGAKVERALDRRMTDQDAVFRPKIISEKTGMGRSVTTRV